jgi:hypothetical protein
VTGRWEPGPIEEVYGPEGEFYAYAPSVVADGAEHVFCCHNTDAGVIRDSIYRVHRVDGEVQSSEPVFGPGPEGSWDEHHVCDPSVVAGDFRYGGDSYRWAMFYLGNDVDASRNNQVGVAFADALDGEWVRHPDPIAEHPTGDSREWGSGQPSAVSIDEGSRVRLFYTQGTAETGTRVVSREVELGPSGPEAGPVAVTPTDGLTTRTGEPDFFNQADFLYDPAGERFYVVRPQRPFADDLPTFITPSVQVASMPTSGVEEAEGTWRAEGRVDPAFTGFPRNHNPGLERDEFGHLPADRRAPEEETGATSLRVVFTTSSSASESDECSAFPDPLWTYNLWAVEAEIPPGG